MKIKITCLILCTFIFGSILNFAKGESKISLTRDGKTTQLKNVTTESPLEEIIQAIIQVDGNKQYSITHEPGNITYTDTNGKVFDGIGTITIRSGDQSITMLDRNLGATKVGIGCEDGMGGRCTPEDRESYGYYFQRGNNYGFSYYDAINDKIEGAGLFVDQLAENKYAWNNPLVSSKTVYLPHEEVAYGGIKNFKLARNLWGSDYPFHGGEYEICGENACDFTRQGPCPAGYHVPGKEEINKLIQMYWIMTRGNFSISDNTYDRYSEFLYQCYSYNGYVYGFDAINELDDSCRIEYTGNFQPRPHFGINDMFKIPKAGAFNVDYPIDLRYYYFDDADYVGRLKHNDPNNKLYFRTTFLRLSTYELKDRSSWFGTYTYTTPSGFYKGEHPGNAAPIRCFKDQPLDDNGTQSLILEYETNGGSAIQAQTIPAGYSGYLPGYTTHKKGHNLVGWFNEDETVQYNLDDRGVTFTNLMMTDELADNNGVVKVYAKWEKNSDENDEPQDPQTSCDLKEGIYYEDSVLDYTDHKGKRFQPGTITVSDGKDCITMLDRNLGATMTGGMFDNGTQRVKYYYHPDTYGYFYQWGNNYGFSTRRNSQGEPSGEHYAGQILLEEEKSFEKVKFENYGPGNYYNSNIFRLQTYHCDGDLYAPYYCFSYSDTYWSRMESSNMRGGGNDSPENERGLYLDNDADRQGPCPNGYHIPSAGEWKKLHLIRHNYTNKGTIKCDACSYGHFLTEGLTGIQNDLYLPAPGWLGPNYDIHFRTETPPQNEQKIQVRNNKCSRYQTSTPSISIEISGTRVGGEKPFPENVFIRDTVETTYALPIRCFKNRQEETPQTISYKVSFVDNDSIIDTKFVASGSTVSELTNLKKDGYTFKGRYSDSNLTKLYNFSTKVTSDITIYAKWDKNSNGGGNTGGDTGGNTGGQTNNSTYTISFDSNGGTRVGNIPVKHGAYVANPSSSTKKGYTFLGRYTAKNGGTKVYFPYQATSDALYYAHREENTYSIRYNLNGGRGSISDEENIRYTESIRLPSTPTRDGYSFNGWNTKSNGKGTHYDGGEYVSKLAEGGNLTLYAQRKQDKNSDSGSSTSSSSSTSSNLSIQIANSKNPTIDDWIGVIIRTDKNYTGRITFPKVQFYSFDTQKWINVSLNNKSYVYDYDDYMNDGLRMASSDNGYKVIQKLIKFDQEGNYRIYVTDKNGAEKYLQLYVDPKAKTNIQITPPATQTTSQTTPQSTSQTTPTSDKITISTVYTGATQSTHGVDSSDEVYISRSCKSYRIQYNSQLGVYTSPDLDKNEYFVSKEYFKRYVDSKNPQKDGCPKNLGWVSAVYLGGSTSSDHYIAPNGKVYFISDQNGSYLSSQLNFPNKSFVSLSGLQYYIRDRNPLIKM